MFLSETLCKVDVVSSKLTCLGFVNRTGVDVVSRRGGLVLGWTDDYLIFVLDKSPNQIQVEVFNQCSQSWMMTAIYSTSSLQE